MFYWNPKRLKELKEKGLKIKVMTLKEYNLTNNQKCDRENNNEKIQNKIIRNGNTRSRNNIISKLSNS
jgi:HKD family nuclease